MACANDSHGPDEQHPPDAPLDEGEADPKDVVIARLRAEVGSLEQQLEATAQQRDELLVLLQRMDQDIREIRGMLREKIERTPPTEPSEDSSTS